MCFTPNDLRVARGRASLRAGDLQSRLSARASGGVLAGDDVRGGEPRRRCALHLTICAWPGVGRLSVQAIYNRDYPLVQAAVFLLATTFVVVNLVVDVLYTY